MKRICDLNLTLVRRFFPISVSVIFLAFLSVALGNRGIANFLAVVLLLHSRSLIMANVNSKNEKQPVHAATYPQVCAMRID